jgi:hypothetical protein
LELCLAWRHSYLALLDVASSPARSNIARIRECLLNELERRDRDALHLLADGRAPAAHLIPGEVRLPGVSATSDALADAETHAKTLIAPAPRLPCLRRRSRGRT